MPTNITPGERAAPVRQIAYNKLRPITGDQPDAPTILRSGSVIAASQSWSIPASGTPTIITAERPRRGRGPPVTSDTPHHFRAAPRLVEPADDAADQARIFAGS